jgi:hypothetical protein
VIYLTKVSSELLEKRRGMMEEFMMFSRISTQRLAERRAKRLELRNGN